MTGQGSKANGPREELMGAGLSSRKQLKCDREKGLDTVQLHVGSGLLGFRNNCSWGKKDKMKEQNTN